MQITRITGIFLIGVLLIIGACGSPARITPPTTTPGTGPAAFITSELTITPKTVKPGEPVEVGVMVTNRGGEQGTYTVVMKLHDGTIIKTQDVTLAGGARQKVTLNMSMNSVGTYMIMIDKLESNLVVKNAVAPAPTQPTPTPSQPAPTPPNQPPPPPPATGRTGFIVSNLGIDPEMPDVGEDVMVSVKVTNAGGQQETYSVVVKIDGATVATKDITLAAGVSQIVNLGIKAPNKEGTFTITVGDQTLKMVVMGM